MSRGIPILLPAIRLAGMLATLLPVARAVAAGVGINFQNLRTPLFPPASAAYRVKAAKKYTTDTG
jgi:hypothetical protein